jgi:hypothetical protein
MSLAELNLSAVINYIINQALDQMCVRGQIDQIKLNNPYHTVKQVCRALITWRDRSSAEDKATELLHALTMVYRNDLVHDLHVTYNLSEGTSWDKVEGKKDRNRN